ncbi:hypothetical protein B0H17DRAFT_1216269 [Mycena rosella]|uniref:Uncharacterized protein n=1 Tax=Mycena rosella TaxID=1033263 RepID=A0AAD7FU12_MYCRO|nr:hypothetical protein B0H17DRAFT_1216269 [Mycena rosella]
MTFSTSSAPTTTTPKADQPRPIPILPTLLTVPSLSFPTAAPALTAVPTAANEKLKAVLDSASVASMNDDRVNPALDSDFDPELEMFFDGDHALAPAHDAGKGKDKAPPPPPPTEGASTSAHPLFARLGFTPGAKLPTRFTTGDHRTARTHIDAMAAELAKMGDKLAWVQNDLTDAADSLNTQIHSLGDFVNAQTASRSAPHDDGTTPSWSMPATSTPQTPPPRLLPSRAQRLLGSRPSPGCCSRPSVPPAEFVNANGKHARDDYADDATRNVHQHAGAVVAIPRSSTTSRTAARADRSVTPAPVAIAAQAAPLSLFPPTTPLRPPHLLWRLLLPRCTAFRAAGCSVPQCARCGSTRAAAAPDAPGPFGPITFGLDPKLAKGEMARILAHMLPKPAASSSVSVQHDTVELPPGYSILSQLNLKIREDLSGPDFMVIQMGKLLIYNVYILPETAQWAGVLDRDPCEALAASLALAFTAHFLVALLGDLNARIAELLANPSDPPRTSMDEGNPSPRGRWLCKLLDDYKLAFVSGAMMFGPSSGKITSFQGAHRPVIDYAVCSKDLFQDMIHTGDLDIQNVTFATSRKKRKVDIVLPDETHLDKVLIATLTVGKDETMKLLALYGPVTDVTTPLKVTVHGSCINAGKLTASAGAAAYWGPNAP